MFNSFTSTSRTSRKPAEHETPSLKSAEYERVRENFKSFVRRAGQTIRDPKGDWPLLVLLERDGRISTQCLAGYTIETMADREHLARVVLPAIVREHEPRVAGFAFPCWTVSSYADPDLDTFDRTHDSLAEHPARVEGVTLLVFDDDENVEAWLAPVTRRQKRPPKLGPWSTVAAADGRFVQPMQRAMVGAPATDVAPPARPETAAFYQLLLTNVAPCFGDEGVEDVFLIAKPDELLTLSLDELTELADGDVRALAQSVFERTAGMKHFAFVLKVSGTDSFLNSDLYELYGDEEVVTLIVADDVGMTAFAVSIVREGGESRLGDWAAAGPLPVDVGLFRYANDLRQTI